MSRVLGDAPSKTKPIARFKPARLAKMFAYLDTLRQSGVTNMFGAGSYVGGAFNLDQRDSSAVLTAWMKTFEPETSPVDRAKAALAPHQQEEPK